MSKEQELWSQLSSSRETEIIGVVCPSGAGGAHYHDDKLCHLGFFLVSWKEVGGPIQTSKVYVRKKIPDEEFSIYWCKIQPYDVLRLNARLAMENVFGRPEAMLTNIVGKDSSDPELNAYSLKLQEPVTFEDSQLGVFTLDRSLDQIESHPQWGDCSVRLTIPAESPEETQNCLAAAHTLWNNQAEWQRRIKEFLSLECERESWLGENELDLTPQDFSQRMVVTDINVHEDDSFEFWHEDGVDGSFFRGHSIVVRGNLKDGPTSADIEG